MCNGNVLVVLPHTDTRRPRQMTAQEITKGATVYGTGGEKMGTIQAYNAHGGYLVVRTGWLFPTDLHIPLYAFQGTDAHGDVHLGLCKSDLRNDRDGASQAPRRYDGRLDHLLVDGPGAPGGSTTISS